MPWEPSSDFVMTISGKWGRAGLGGREGSPGSGVEVLRAGCLAWGQRNRVPRGSETGRTEMGRAWKAGFPPWKGPPPPQ